ncbi:hypothetical protein DPMN_025677 [Dreissena polymorpha]|uniref:Cystatin domain-containing protein n=1 Tax=Dreissena polymorpha TaxID=45954 RepID=A0A9D4LRT1_DREPO|nr:hypothetical protein DPMN_025677 [Dreissena polymorpha]
MIIIGAANPMSRVLRKLGIMHPNDGITRRPKPGGLTPVADVNDVTIQSMTRNAIQKLGSAYSLTRVISASTQVVAGTLYHLELQCRKPPNRPLPIFAPFHHGKRYM